MTRRTVYPELWDKVCKKNKVLLDDFIEYCKGINRSDSTIKGYYNDIEIFMVWNLNNNDNKFFVDLTKRDVIKYQNWMITDKKLSSSRVRRLRAALTSLSNYIELILDDIYPDFRPIINKVPAPPVQTVREKTVLEDKQVDYLLDYLVDKKMYQQACAVALAVSSGSRKSELLRFKVSYFVDENIVHGSLYKTPEKVRVKGRGDGKYVYRYVLAHKFKPYFDLWIEQREELGITGDELFWTKREDGWIPAGISLLNSWALTFSKVLNLRWYWHSNRHYFTTMLCKANIPAEVIRDMIGWQNLDMVSLYSSVSVDDELGKYFDESGIKDIDVGILDKLGK